MEQQVVFADVIEVEEDGAKVAVFAVHGSVFLGPNLVAAVVSGLHLSVEMVLAADPELRELEAVQVSAAGLDLTSRVNALCQAAGLLEGASKALGILPVCKVAQTPC